MRCLRDMGAVRGTLYFMRDAATEMHIPDGILAWDADGRITLCGRYQDVHAQLPPDTLIQDYRSHLITPGFVDCHVHLPQLDCRNKTGHTLLDWLWHHIYPAEAAFADPAIARDTARRFFRELLRNGTTTTMIYSTIHEEATRIAFEEAEVAGVRAIIGKVLMDQNCPDALKEKTSKSLAATERLIRDWHGRDSRLFYAVTPRFALTCSRELLEGAGRIVQETGCYFQTHIAETRDEVAQTVQLFGTTDYVGIYGRCHCLGDKSMFAHCIYLRDSEWRQLSESRSAVAHCPSSNIFLKSGRMPYEEVARHHVRCGLGSDVGAGPELSLWDVMRCGCEVHPAKVFSSKEAFTRATLGGAEALGFADQIGSFEIGKKADAAVFDVLSADAAMINLPVPVATYVNGCRCSATTPVSALTPRR